MNSYNIRYEILDYNKLHNRLKQIVNNERNINPITVHNPIGQTKCGFDIEHYSIGKGPKHIVYMGCAHGNEIISTDYITQLMENIALGNGDYENFDSNEFTLDFIPCQNPEGFYTTTYALNSIMKGMNETEIETFCKKYWADYREDDINFLAINYIFDSFCKKFPALDSKTNILRQFWQQNRSKEITPESIISFLEKKCHIKYEDVYQLVMEKWHEKLKEKTSIPAEKGHHKIFKGISIDCIPEIDEKHKKLKEALRKIYSTGKFPIETLANFFSNSSGVNLNDNNEFYYNELKERIAKEGNVYANLRDNNILKSNPGPVGTPSANLDAPFEYASENKALLKFLEEQDDKNENYAFFNIHSAGGLLYIYPVDDSKLETKNNKVISRNFNFFINNRLATEYAKSTGQEYEEKTGVNNPYKTMGHPDRITGVGDLLRKKYIASFILELSKMGGNPIGPYGDRQNNYNITMTANMRANMKFLQTILTISHLYDTSYSITYDKNGKVHYSEGARLK